MYRCARSKMAIFGFSHICNTSVALTVRDGGEWDVGRKGLFFRRKHCTRFRVVFGCQLNNNRRQEVVVVVAISAQQPKMLHKQLVLLRKQNQHAYTSRKKSRVERYVHCATILI